MFKRGIFWLACMLGLTLSLAADTAASTPAAPSTDEQIKAAQDAQKEADKAKSKSATASHGFAFLERIRNMTEFPVSLFYDKTIHDLLPANTVVRLKSYKAEYGVAGRYFAARLEGGAWRLKADTTDPEDPATQFVVHRHILRDLSDWLGFTAMAAGKAYLNANLSQAVQFGSEEFASDDKPEAHWKIIGSTIDRCSLQNQLTGGLLSCRSEADRTKLGAYVPPAAVTWTWVAKGGASHVGMFASRTEETSLQSKTITRNDVLSLSNSSGSAFDGLDTISTGYYTITVPVTKKVTTFWVHSNETVNASHVIRATSNPYLIHEIICFIDKTRHHIFAGGNVAVALATIGRFAVEGDAARTRLIEKKKEVHYGDKIKLVHHDTWQQLYGTGSMVFAGNNDSPNEHSNEKDSWFIIKGPHKKNDPWNCNIGVPVKNGDVIRLEHVTSKKNVSCTQKAAPAAAVKVSGVTPDAGPEYAVALAGTNGLNDDSDNWTVTFETDSPVLYEGSNFYITNRNTGFSLRSNLELTAQSPNKQRVTAFQSKKPACRWFVNAVEYGELPVVDVAWTGFPNGSPALDEGPKETIGFEIVKLGMGGGIAPGMTLDLYMPLQDKKPKAIGFAKQEIPGFGPGQLITLSPLLSKGASWLQQSFKEEGKATITFLARATDKGNVQVLFGNNVSLDFTWKIIIGASDNTKAQIIRRDLKGGVAEDVVVAEVDKSENPLAAATPGLFLPYWVSVDNGTILVGMSTTPGENVFMAWRDPKPRTKVSRVGFCTHDAVVEYTNVQMTTPVTAQRPSVTYATKKDEISLSSTPLWLSSPFRVPGRGTMSFDARGEKQLTIYIANEGKLDSPHYRLELYAFPKESETIVEKGSNEPVVSAVLSKWDDGAYKELARTQDKDDPTNFLPADKFTTYWICINQGRIFVGRGEIGKGLFLYHWDLNPYDNVKRFGLSTESGGRIANLTVTPPVTIAEQATKESYQDEKKLFDFTGSLYVISPYEYLLSQENQSVKFEDKINKKTYYPGKTPQQNALYYFMLVLQADGFPSLEWVREPENPTRLELDKSAYITRSQADAWFQASTFVQGMGALGGMAGVTASIIYAQKGQSAMSAAGAKEAESSLNYRGHDSYVYTDQAVQGQLATSEIPPAAQSNKQKADEKIELGGKWSPTDMDKLERLIPLYQQVVNLITHPYVVQDKYIKQSLFDAISSMYQAHQTLHADPSSPADLTYSGMINLLISAYNNAYLIDTTNKQEKKLKEVWYSQTNELVRQLMQKDPNAKLTLQPCYGEYIWLNTSFETPGKGSVSFEAKGTNDIFIAFSSAPVRVRNTDTNLYETVLGAWDNEKTVIRVKSLDKAVAETTDKNALVNQIQYQKYWISVNNGRVVVGKGELDEKNKIFEWTDPYPIKDVAYVGISTWNAEVAFQNIQVSVAVEDIAAYKQKLINQIMELRKQQAAAAEAKKVATAKPAPTPVVKEKTIVEEETVEEPDEEPIVEEEPTTAAPTSPVAIPIKATTTTVTEEAVKPAEPATPAKEAPATTPEPTPTTTPAPAATPAVETPATPTPAPAPAGGRYRSAA